MSLKELFDTALDTASDMSEDDNIFVSLVGVVCQLQIFLMAAMAIFAFIATYLFILLYAFCGDSFFGRTVCCMVAISPIAMLAICMAKNVRKPVTKRRGT